MSLDVSLISKTPVLKRGTGVFVRDGGGNRELTIAEVKERYPNSDITEQEFETNEVYEANITHNLNRMADAAGIYEHLWTPDKIGITKAIQLIDPLREGLHKLKSDRAKYEAFNPSNGWGSYEGLVSFVQNYLDACYQWPDADIEVSR
jgi:hypothetical protein